LVLRRRSAGELEQSGLIERQKYQSRPDRFEYLPTRRGYDIALVMHAMREAGDKWDDSGLGGPPIRIVNRRTGHDVQLVLVDRGTGERARPADLSAQPGSGADDLTRWRLGERVKAAKAGADVG
jgi:hypothetical protein